MKKITLHKQILNKLAALCVTLTLLLGVFLFTNPDEVSLAVLLVPFLLLGYAAYVCISLLMGVRGLQRATGALQKLIPLSGAFLVVALLLLASLGQLTLRDGLLVVGFTGFFLIYVARADFLK